jgi:thioredoxin-dependent peroxiredoxin
LKAYQADGPKLEASDTVVFGVSGDSPAANAAYAKQIDVHFPLLSDPGSKVLKSYGVPQRMKQVGSTSYELAQRATFVIDKQGVIQHVDFGQDAVDPAKTVTSCSLLEHRKPQP